MINSKYTKLYLLGLVTTVTLGVTYAYSSISNSLTYLRGAGDTGHIGYIITEIFGTGGTSSGKIKQQYLELPDSFTLVDSTGSTSITQAPTAKILKDVWDNLNARLTTVSGTVGSIDISTKVDKNANITAGTATKITYDAKGLVTTGTSLSATDIPVLDTGKITSGTFNIARLPTGTTSTTVSVGNHGHSDATTSVSGFMSSTDKTKLDGIAANANNYVHPSGDGNSHVPATSTTNNGKVLTAGSTANSASWQVLPTSSTSVAGIVQLNNTLTSTATNQALTAAQGKVLQDNKAPIASPALTGTPTRTTPPTDGDESTQLATTARVKANTVSAAAGISTPNCYYSTTSCDSTSKMMDGEYTIGGASNVSHKICCFMGTVSALASICTSDTLGLTCTGNVKNMGIFNGYRYMTTPGNCTDSATPTCNGTVDTLTKTWGTNGTTTYMNSNDGAYNTMILAGYSDTNAAKYCDTMVYGGFSDWYLPSKEELMYMYKIRNSIGGFASNNYWSSTEDTNMNAWRQSFINGDQSSYSKTYLHFPVRCIRKY